MDCLEPRERAGPDAPELSARIAKLEALIHRLEWVAGICPLCFRLKEEGHATNCELHSGRLGE